jgi:hypothetical protein
VPTARPATPAPTPRPTPRPTPDLTPILILWPPDGDESSDAVVALEGSGPAGVELVVINNHNGDYLLTRDDIRYVTAVDGLWRTSLTLTEGFNKITVGRDGGDEEHAILLWYFTPETPAPTEEPITYDTPTSREWAQLVKDPDAAAGNGYRIWACISQFDAATGPSTFRAQASYRNEEFWWSDGENAVFRGDEGVLADYVEGDVVRMNARTLGAFTYDTNTGGTATAPEFSVATIKREGDC